MRADRCRTRLPVPPRWRRSGCRRPAGVVTSWMRFFLARHVGHVAQRRFAGLRRPRRTAGGSSAGASAWDWLRDSESISSSVAVAQVVGLVARHADFDAVREHVLAVDEPNAPSGAKVTDELPASSRQFDGTLTRKRSPSFVLACSATRAARRGRSGEPRFAARRLVLRPLPRRLFSRRRLRHRLQARLDALERGRVADRIARRGSTRLPS